jgi:hypothetical protein
MIKRIAAIGKIANSDTVNTDIVENVTEELNRLLPSSHQLAKAGPEFHEHSQGGVSWEVVPKLWSQPYYSGKVHHDGVIGGLLLMVGYGPELKSNSPVGELRGDWAKAGGDPELSGTVVDFILEAGYFKRALGLSVKRENRIAVGTGYISVVDHLENIELSFDDPQEAVNTLTKYITSIWENPPVGSEVQKDLNKKARDR